MRTNTVGQTLLIGSPAVLGGLVIAVSVVSPFVGYAGQRFAMQETNHTTPWRVTSERAAVATETVATHVSLTEIVAEMKAGGFPVASIAHFADVERKTVYSWLDGISKPHPDREQRVSEVYPILKQRFEGDFNLMHRVWRSKTRDGTSLEAILTAATIDLTAVDQQLAYLSTSIDNLRATDTRRKSRPSGAMNERNGFVEESMIADFDRT